MIQFIVLILWIGGLVDWLIGGCDNVVIEEWLNS